MAAQRNKKKMVRSCRVFLNDLNHGKVVVITDFLYQCRTVTQYFVDLFWQRLDFGGKLADLPTVHRAVKRFGITTRLSQSLAKQAKECVRSQHKKGRKDKPALRSHTATLYYHFVKIEPFRGAGFDWAVHLIGSGAPRMTLPVHATQPMLDRMQHGWAISRTVRLGLRDGLVFIDFLFEKDRPALRTEGVVVGMDSNYKAGFVFSDGQQVGEHIYVRVQQFGRRQKHSFAEVDSMVGHAVKTVDWGNIKTLAIENLKRVKHGTRGTFSRQLNRRMSHWLYRACEARLERACEEQGIRLERKDPWKTSQTCRSCLRWDRRSRVGDRFKCVHCGHADHADRNASANLEYLATAGKYGFRSPQNADCQSSS